MDADENNGQNDNEDGGALGEEEIALRRNQLLLFGVVLLGILSLCLAVSMPSDLEFNNSAIASDDPINVIENDTPVVSKIAVLTNATNFSRTGYFKNPEDLVENKILRNIAIQKAIQDLSISNPDKEPEDSADGEEDRINQIVQRFMSTEEFEDFIIDIEITDAIKRLRKEKGYKKRESRGFDDLFKEIEKHFLGDDPDEVRVIRRVGEELETRARKVIYERRQIRIEMMNEEEEQFIASEIYKDLDEGSGFENDEFG